MKFENETQISEWADNVDARLAALEAAVPVLAAPRVPQPYPVMLYHADEEPRQAQNESEEKLLASFGFVREHVKVKDPFDATAPAKLRADPAAIRSEYPKKMLKGDEAPATAADALEEERLRNAGYYPEKPEVAV
jgi:hypothetical protein